LVKLLDWKLRSNLPLQSNGFNSFICSSDLEDPPPKAAIPPCLQIKTKASKRKARFFFW
jgi:hypothetical protein